MRRRVITVFVGGELELCLERHGVSDVFVCTHSNTQLGNFYCNGIFFPESRCLLAVDGCHLNSALMSTYDGQADSIHQREAPMVQEPSREACVSGRALVSTPS